MTAPTPGLITSARESGLMTLALVNVTNSGFGTSKLKSPRDAAMHGTPRLFRLKMHSFPVFPPAPSTRTGSEAAFTEDVAKPNATVEVPTTFRKVCLSKLSLELNFEADVEVGSEKPSADMQKVAVLEMEKPRELRAYGK
mmetsp:Transcript_135/g.160  ORF Transcript_135/g.160 Transcript_135/m.160 type:complete len:140 (-) Transcript_135:113-532(-)